MKHSTLFPMFLYPMLLYPVLVALVLCSAPPLVSAAKVGGAAPDFTGTASTGKTFRLSDYRGKYVVLEWHNNGCPFVRKQYNSGNMQQLQKQWTSQGVVWFTILSSAPGKQGYATAQEENDYLAKMQAAPTAALLDPAGAEADAAQLQQPARLAPGIRSRNVEKQVTVLLHPEIEPHLAVANGH